MTVILAVQDGGRVYLAGDTRITTDTGRYTEGNQKVYKVNDKVLAGLAGSWEVLDALHKALPLIKRHKNALAAARALDSLLRKDGRLYASEFDWTVALVARNQVVEVLPTGVVVCPFNDVVCYSTGTGGIAAEAYWNAANHLTERDGVENTLTQAVRTASYHYVNCGPEVRMVHT